MERDATLELIKEEHGGRWRSGRRGDSGVGAQAGAERTERVGAGS